MAVIGCGLIGASWTALLSAHGHAVKVWDAAPGWIDRAQAAVGAALEQLRALGATGVGDISYTATLGDAVRSAYWIQESVSESLDVKRSLYREICVAAPPDSVLASSTSGFNWSELAPFVTDESRLITAHPFNPPHLMPLVEIFAPGAPLGERACGFYRGLGRRPILLRRPATGHVANRLASALWREAVNIVAEGIAGVADVDSAMVDGPGLRWSAIGPHMAYHLGGGAGGIRSYLAHLGDSQVRRWADLGSPSLDAEVRELIAQGVEAEAAGRPIEILSKHRDAVLMAALQARHSISESET